MDSGNASKVASELRLSAADIRRAATEGILSSPDAERLVAWGQQHLASQPSMPAPVESARGFNLVMVAYYFGAALIVSACSWFLLDRWDRLGPAGIMLTVSIYAAVLLGLGGWLRGAGYRVAGGLLITVAVCLTPVAVHALEDWIGFWPRASGRYSFFYRINTCQILMELATIVTAAVALWYVRFGLLTLPLAAACWFLSLDVMSLALGGLMDWNARKQISMAVGLATMCLGWAFDRAQAKRGGVREEDYGFWCWLFGMFAFWGGLTAMDSTDEAGRVAYLLINLGLIAASLWFNRTVMLIFGAIGVHLYLFHLADTLFRDSFLFPFVIALLGLSLIIVTVLAQRYMSRRAKPPRAVASTATSPWSEPEGEAVGTSEPR